MRPSFTILTPEAMEALGNKLAQQISAPAVIALEGDLGAGKTTLVRGFLRALGYSGIVKSPTYGFVESYHLSQMEVHHFDLYRLTSTNMLDSMGFFDYFEGNPICLIEWPEIAKAYLPESTIYCKITVLDQGREVILSC